MTNNNNKKSYGIGFLRAEPERGNSCQELHSAFQIRLHGMECADAVHEVRLIWLGQNCLHPTFCQWPFEPSRQKRERWLI